MSSVLILDDDQDFLEIVVIYLRQVQNLKVTCAHDPQAARIFLEENNYDLIVSDWSFASVTGPELLTQVDPIIKHDEKIPVLFISSADCLSALPSATQFRNFETVSFIRKSFGARVIGVMATQILIGAKRRNELSKIGTRTLCHQG